MNLIHFSATVAFVAVLLGGCSPNCDNEVAHIVSSPSRALRAVVFHRSCGATTGFNTQVSVIKASDSLPNEGGNVLVIESKVPLQVQWQSEDRISVSGLGRAKVFKQERSVIGIVVEFR